MRLETEDGRQRAVGTGQFETLEVRMPLKTVCSWYKCSLQATCVSQGVLTLHHPHRYQDAGVCTRARKRCLTPWVCNELLSRAPQCAYNKALCGQHDSAYWSGQ